MTAKDNAQQVLQELKFKLVGVYKHFKGGYYVAYSVTMNEEPLVPLVHYWSCETKTRWTRSVQNFTEHVPSPGYTGMRPRFEYLHPASWQELAIAAGFDALVEGLTHITQAQHFVNSVLVQPPKT